MRKTIQQVARNNTDAVMAGYTHLQPSEPITFAQYCAAILMEWTVTISESKMLGNS